MNNTEKFTGLSNYYEKGRPKYHYDAIKIIKEKTKLNNDSIILDVGAGNGLLTKMLEEKLSYKKIYAVEPNTDMLEKLKEKFQNDNVKILNTSIENLNIINDVDLITVGQALHWFNIPIFHEKCKQMLKENGNLVLLYNSREINNPLAQDTIELFKKTCPKFKSFSGGLDHALKWQEDLFEESEVIYISNPETFDRENWIIRNLSSSYCLKPHEEKYNEMINGLYELFDKYNKDGIITIENNTVLFIGKIKR